MFKLFILIVLIIVSSVALTGMQSASGTVEYTQASYMGPPLLGRAAQPLPLSSQVWLSFFLPPNNAASLNFAANQVPLKNMEPISQEQVLKYYAPNQSEFNTLIRFLESNGFSVAYVSPDRFSVEAYAKASTVESLFHTTLYTYTYQGETYYAPATQPQIPVQLEGVEISGLTNRTLVQPQYIVMGGLNGTRITPSKLPRSTPSVGLTTAATYYGPSVLQGAYGVNTLLSKGYGG